VHHVAGQDSYLVKVRVKDPEALGRLLRERFGAINTVRSTQSTIALETLKEHWAIPVDPVPLKEKLRA
jgi:Lrp/AsnC family leucine-responsive transcriptional regulator